VFCGKCGNKNPDENKFCAGCGTSLQTIQDSVEETRNEIVEKVETLQNEEKLKNLEEAKEKVYYRGEGELIVRTTKHHGTGRKVASFVAGAGVGYLIAGRDSKRTTKSKGSIVVTNQSIYCAGNKFEFDKILAMSVKGTLQKKIHLTLDKSVSAGGRGEGDKVSGGGRISVEIEIKTDDIDGLFKGLENARMSGVEL
tara:strand:- start:506 stop:1096 length:591 start_codon:yes stop_codon:yes gene_type:complete